MLSPTLLNSLTVLLLIVTVGLALRMIRLCQERIEAVELKLKGLAA